MARARPVALEKLSQDVAFHTTRFSPSGSWAFALRTTDKEPGSIRLWRTDGSLSIDIRASRPGLHAAVISHDDSTLAFASQITDHVELVQLPDGKPIDRHTFIQKPYRRSPAGHFIKESVVADLAFAPCSRRLAIGSWDETARILDLDSGLSTDFPQYGTGNVDLVSFVPDGQLLTATHEEIRRYDPADSKSLHIERLDDDHCWWHGIAHEARQIISISQLDLVRIQPLVGGPARFLTLEPKPPKFERSTRAVSPCGRRLAIGDERGRIWHYSLTDPPVLVARELVGTKAVINSLAFDPPGSRLLVCTSDPGWLIGFVPLAPIDA